MKAITLKPYYFVLFFLFTISVSYAQTVFDHNGNFVIQQDEEYYPGKIILKTNDTLIGRISLNYRIKENFSALFNDGTNDVKIPNKSIGKIILFDRNNEVTEFESLDNSKQLYRILYSGKVKIYDSSSRPQAGNLVGSVFINENNQVYSLFNFWSSGSKQDLIDYINKRDGENFKRRDFKTNDAIFAYLDK
ncbi:hypothetical protein ACI6PS_05630 [Flavobacterium sp. PLA-1-15]|uniref:hypothetical protein n=1 Tax=Flavobacterium sp. PLA-1-15 TaxID=3380533 RepID=UPI003B7E7938